MTAAPAPRTPPRPRYANPKVEGVKAATSYLLAHQRRDVLRAIFGPDNWTAKAARAFGVTPSHVKKLAAGRRALTLRHWYILEAASSHRSAERMRELERAQAAIAQRYREHEGKVRGAAQTVRQVMLRIGMTAR